MATTAATSPFQHTRTAFSPSPAPSAAAASVATAAAPILRPAETLFARRVPVSLRSHFGQTATAPAAPVPASSAAVSGSSPSLMQERKHPGITITVGNSSRNGDRHRVLEIRLTDDDDPHFFYHLDITEEDFHVLKSQQNLLIDFSQFPYKFIELLEACIASANESNPKFIAQLQTDPSARFASFVIVETNSFKHINHLALQFVPGTDATIRQYLAELVKELKSDNADLRERLNNTGASMNMRLDEAETKILQLTSELDQAKISNSNIATQLKLEHTTELAREREQNARDRESIRVANEKELREAERRYDEEVKRLSQKLASITAAHSHVSQHAQSLESSLASATKQNESLVRERDSLKQDLERASTQQQQTGLARSELETTLAAAREHIKDLESRDRESQESIRKLEERLNLLTEQKVKVEETAGIYKTQTARLEESLKKASDEISKGNEIIRKLQTEMKNNRSKIKLKNIVTLQQEKLLDERAVTIETLQKETTGLKDSLAKKTEECDQLQMKADDLKKKLDEGKAIIEDNNHVIEWLHKQLNDEALNRPLVSGLTNSAAAGIAGIDFDKYASVAATGSDPNRKSPTRLTSAYRSRYVPQDASTSPMAQVQLPSRLQSPAQQNHTQQHASDLPPQALNHSSSHQSSYRATRTGLGQPSATNIAVRAPITRTGASPTMQDPFHAGSDTANAGLHAHNTATTTGLFGAGAGRSAMPTKTSIPVMSNFGSATQPPVKSSYF